MVPRRQKGMPTRNLFPQQCRHKSFGSLEPHGRQTCFQMKSNAGKRHREDVIPPAVMDALSAALLLVFAATV
jgi:hypothetical protein